LREIVNGEERDKTILRILHSVLMRNENNDKIRGVERAAGNK